MPAGEEILRRSIASAGDGRVRARLRVELAQLLRGSDPASARDQLDEAAREGGATPALTSAALSLARTMPVADQATWLASLARTDGNPPAPMLASALAEAQLGADRPREAALTWLGLARDDRVPVHHRRAAARRAVRLAGRVDGRDAGAILSVAAALATGKPREELLRRARGLLGAVAPDETEDPVAGQKHGEPRPERAPPALAAMVRSRVPRVSPPPMAVLDRALAEARAGHANRARRLGEEATRLLTSGPELAGAVGALDTALREGGFMKDALRLRRTHLEALDRPAARPALLSLAAEAQEAGLGALAADWRTDAGVKPTAAPIEPPAPATPTEHYLAAQRLLAGDGPDVAPARVLAQLEKGLAGHPGADAALALAEAIAARVLPSTPQGAGDDHPRASPSVALDLLRAAHASEHEARRRARLGKRLAETLEQRGDLLGAAAVLEGALAEAAPGEGQRMRAERARLLRRLGRTRELAAALEKDAGALAGDARLAVLAEHATLLEAAGEAEKGLDVRLMALAEFPGAPSVLDDARRRLEATGRAAESLTLAIAALDHTTDAGRRRQLLRDVAT
ncbi:MAG TPA: hypothetical protein VKO16_08085, partial [Polyangia bacterium]|nr:hypothetical protein [Polyangia bacterium]